MSAAFPPPLPRLAAMEALSKARAAPAVMATPPPPPPAEPPPARPIQRVDRCRLTPALPAGAAEPPPMETAATAQTHSLRLPALPIPTSFCRSRPPPQAATALRASEQETSAEPRAALSPRRRRPALLQRTLR